MPLLQLIRTMPGDGTDAPHESPCWEECSIMGPIHLHAIASLVNCSILSVQRQRRRTEAAAALHVQPPLSADAIKQRRIVVTGMGLVSSLGHEVEHFYSQLLEVSRF